MFEPNRMLLHHPRLVDPRLWLKYDGKKEARKDEHNKAETSCLLLVFASGSKTVPTKYLFLGFIMFIVVFRPGGHVHPHCLGTYLTHARTLKAFVFKVLRNALNVATYFTHARTLKAFVFKVLRNGLPRYILYTCPNLM